MPEIQPIGLSGAFAKDSTKQMQWRAFLSKNKLEHMELSDVVGAIRERALRLGIPRQ